MRNLLIVILFTLSFPAYAQLKIFACEPEWADLAQELGVPKESIYSATTGKQDVHHIEARPSLLAQARQADLLICTGAELEAGWLPILLNKTGNPKIQSGQPGHFLAVDFVLLKEKPSSLDRSEGDIHAAGNPHIQTDPHNITQVAQALNQRLQQLDRAQALHYEKHYQNFSQHWQRAIKDWEQRATPLKGMPIVVYHRAWIYLEEWLGLKEVTALEPKPGIPPSSGHLAQVLQTLQKQSAKAIIYSAYEDPKPSEWLSSQAGIPTVKLPSTVGGTDTAPNLFKMFEDIITRLLAVAS